MKVTIFKDSRRGNAQSFLLIVNVARMLRAVCPVLAVDVAIGKHNSDDDGEGTFTQCGAAEVDRNCDSN